MSKSVNVHITQRTSLLLLLTWHLIGSCIPAAFARREKICPRHSLCRSDSCKVCISQAECFAARRTQSEIVVSIMRSNGLLGVLDIDSDFPAAFDEVDQRALRRICMRLSQQGLQQQ